MRAHLAAVRRGSSWSPSGWRRSPHLGTAPVLEEGGEPRRGGELTVLVRRDHHEHRPDDDQRRCRARPGHLGHRVQVSDARSARAFTSTTGWRSGRRPTQRRPQQPPRPDPLHRPERHGVGTRRGYGRHSPPRIPSQIQCSLGFGCPGACVDRSGWREVSEPIHGRPAISGYSAPGWDRRHSRGKLS